MKRRLFEKFARWLDLTVSKRGGKTRIQEARGMRKQDSSRAYITLKNQILNLHKMCNELGYEIWVCKEDINPNRIVEEANKNKNE